MVHTDFALRRPVTTLMAFAAVAVIGIVSSRLLPLEQYPDVSFPFMGAGVPYPGSTPEETEELITRPIEDALATLPGIEEIRSTSSDEDARFEIRFAWGTDINTAGFEVRNKLDSVRCAAAQDRRPHVDVDGIHRRFAHAHGALLGRPGSVLAVRPARPLFQEAHRAHRWRGARRARRRRSARGAHPRRSGPARRARRGHPPARAAAREEQLLGRRGPDHRQWRTPFRAPARRIPFARRDPQPGHQEQRARRRRRERRAGEPGDHAPPPSRRPPCRGSRCLQVHPGQRGRSGRSRAGGHRTQQGAAADAGHPRVHHRQPGRGDPLLAERSHRGGPHRRRARLRRAVPVPAALAHDA